MADFEHLVVTEVDGIVTVRLNRFPERNSLNRRMMVELTEFARSHRRRADVRAIVLAGSPDFFSAGADLAEAGTNASVERTLLELREHIALGPDMCRAWEEVEAVTLIAMEGYCVGGACALSLCCDFRIMGDGGMMRLPEVPLGMNMSWNSLPRLTTLIGPSRAKRFAMFGDAVPAATLFDWGLVDVIANAGDAEAEAMRWATRLAALPPLPIRMTKEAINAHANAAVHATSFMDRDQFLLTANTTDLKEGITAFFEKRSPRFEGN